jgi:hypothetical protein
MKASELPAQAGRADQGRLADRLLRSAAARSYDPRARHRLVRATPT